MSIIITTPFNHHYKCVLLKNLQFLALHTFVRHANIPGAIMISVRVTIHLFHLECSGPSGGPRVGGGESLALRYAKAKVP